MKKTLLSLSLMASVSLAAAQTKPIHKKLGHRIPKISWNTKIALIDSLKQSCKQAIHEYVSCYDYPHPTLLISDTSENEHTDGSPSNILAHGKMGKIIINTQAANTSKKKFHDIIMHELTHTIALDSIIFPKPYSMTDGANAYGVQGLGLLVQLPNGSHTKFMTMEEGAAEYLAASRDPQYTMQNFAYYAVTQIYFALESQGRITPAGLVSAIENSDIEYIVRAVTKNSLSEETLQTTTHLFSDAFGRGKVYASQRNFSELKNRLDELFYKVGILHK